MEQIEREVLAGNLAPGERLPSEERLCERFGASRTVIREAIQQLKGRGLLRTTKGSGSYIADPSLTTLGSAVAAYTVLALEADFVELIDFRILIETECARLAAGRLDGSARKDLDRILQQMAQACGSKDTFGELDIAFHLRIAHASQSRMYATLLAALEARCIDYAQTNRGSDVWYVEVIQAHQEILDALIDADAERAATAMRAHLVTSRQQFIALRPTPD